jgi:exonuclease III
MPNSELRLISWNVNGRVKAIPQQMSELSDRAPDMVALQEVRLSALDWFASHLAEMGLSYFIDSVRLADALQRRYGEVIASRWPLLQIDGTEEGTPFPERLLSAVIATPWGDVEFHTAHIPPGVSNGVWTLEMYEGIYRRLAHHSDIPRILCGDFNTPQMETTEGRIITWGEKIKKDGAIVLKADDRRCDAAERCILQGLAPFDLPDIFRTLNGYEVEAYSWFFRTKHGTTQRRFDHIFASQALKAVKCRYLPHLVEAGLSDHAAIEAVFRPS